MLMFYQLETVDTLHTVRVTEVVNHCEIIWMSLLVVEAVKTVQYHSINHITFIVLAIFHFDEI